MIILAIDTCGFFYSLAILKDGEILSQIKATEKNMQCEELIWQIETLLARRYIDYSHIDLLAVTTGPGTFNGVRIGMSAAYGISLSLSIDITTVSTIEVMAYKMKATSICFAADTQLGFLQKFNNDLKPISDIIQTDLHDIDVDVVIFDINDYDKVGNAAIVGLIAMNSKRKEGNLFYGKPPSINMKNLPN